MEICRLCFNSTQEHFTPLNLEDGSSHRKQIEAIFPEMDLKAVFNPILCINCSSALESAYIFKNNWLECEKKLRNYLEGSNVKVLSLTELIKEENENKCEINNFNNEGDEIKVEKSVFCEICFTSECKCESLITKKNFKSLNVNKTKFFIKKECNLLEKDFPCDVCLKSFSTKLKMKRHRIIHDNRSRSYVCNICQQSFFTKSILTNHMTTHVKIKEFSCEKCGLSFASKKYLNEHSKRLHERLKNDLIQLKNVKVGEFECDMCNRKFTQKRYLTQHISNIHLGVKRKRTPKNLKCETCGQIFTSNNLLTLHIRTHTGERPYKCDRCEKSFAQASSLRTHKQAIHSNEKPFTCEYCGKKFSTKGMLLKHIQAVHIADTIPKNHKCSFCGKAFRAKSQMLLHIRWHTNDRRFSCDICGKSFVNNACLKKHRRIHFDEKEFKCEICGKGFHQKFNLKIHMKVHVRVE